MALKMFDVIRYEGENTRNILAWRHPKTDIKSGSTLIVNPGQCAILFSNGKELAPIVDGRGGGKPDMAMAGGSNQAKIQELLDAVAGKL